MERDTVQSEQAETAKYAHDVLGKVDFMFQRRRVARDAGQRVLELNNTETKFVAPAFTENFMDAPDMVEITLLDDDNPMSDRGVLVITEHTDHDSVYSSLYAICAHNIQAGSYVVKDVRRLPIERDRFDDDSPYKSETIFDDAPVDESERQALMAMIAKL